MRLLKLMGMLASLAASGCATVSYDAGPTAKTLAPVHKSFGLGAQFDVPSGTILRQAKVDGKLAYCTVNPIVKRFLEPPRGGCFFDTKASGSFDRFYMLGTIDMGGSGWPEFAIPYALTNATFPQTVQDLEDGERLARDAAAACNAEPSAGEVLALGIVGVMITSVAQKGACDNYYRSIGVVHP